MSVKAQNLFHGSQPRSKDEQFFIFQIDPSVRIFPKNESKIAKFFKNYFPNFCFQPFVVVRLSYKKNGQKDFGRAFI